MIAWSRGRHSYKVVCAEVQILVGGPLNSMHMHRTVSLAIKLPTEFLNFIETCNEIYNEYIEWIFTNNSYNKNKIHVATYGSIRKKYPSIPSALIQTIRDTASENVKALKFKFKPNKSKHSSVRYDKRVIQLRGSKLLLSWSGKRIKQNVNIPKFFLKRYQDFNFQSATIGWDKIKKQFKLNLTFKATKPKVNSNNKTLGIDRGLFNIVSLSNGTNIKSNNLRKHRRKFLFLVKQLQAKGTRSAKRRLKALNGREKRFSLNENHKISKCIANLPYDTFVLEDLKGITKQKSRGKKFNKWLTNWTFFQLETLLTYKAEALGKKIVKVNPAYTSQMCSKCLHIDPNSRNKSRYVCKNCGNSMHADINAAINIANKHLCSKLATEQGALKNTSSFSQPSI